MSANKTLKWIAFLKQSPHNYTYHVSSQHRYYRLYTGKSRLQRNSCEATTNIRYPTRVGRNSKNNWNMIHTMKYFNMYFDLDGFVTLNIYVEERRWAKAISTRERGLNCLEAGDQTSASQLLLECAHRIIMFLKSENILEN